MKTKKNHQSASQPSKRAAMESISKEIGADPPEELGLIKRLSVKLSNSQQVALASLAFGEGLTKPTQTFNWLLDRATRPHIYIPLSAEMEKKILEYAKAQGLDAAAFVYYLILRSLLPVGAQDINPHALATGSPPQLPPNVKTNWAGGKFGPRGAEE